MFPIKMTFTVSTEGELARLLAAVAPDLPATASTPAAVAPQPEPEAKKSKPEKAKSEPKTETKTTEAASAAQPADTPATTEPTAVSDTPAGALSYETDVKPLFLELVKVKGRNAGRKVIDHFDASKDKLSEAVKPSQLAECKAMIEEALK